jgi:site-specific DNA recombinase
MHPQSTSRRRRRGAALAEPTYGRRAVALYLRVSTEEQAERQTIDQQRDKLRAYCRALDDGPDGPYDYAGAREYADDGVSGTLALDDRPAGRQLLADCREGRIGLVIFARIDRFARDLQALLDAQRALEGLGVNIASVAEQFDTGTPAGRLCFQILGAIAEFDRATTVERLAGGRRAAVRAGKFVGGVIPFGLDVDADGRPVRSAHRVEPLGMTEAEAADDIFARIAAGSNAVAECKRLEALGVVPGRRYAGGTFIPTPSGRWLPNRIAAMIRNPLYKGEAEVDWQVGAEVVPVPAVTTPERWAAANRQMDRNRAEARADARRAYPLTGLIRCACGYTYVGNPKRSGDGRMMYYYRCARQVARAPKGGAIGERCHAPVLNAERLEAAVWADLRAFAADPGGALEQARGQLAGRLARAAEAERERQPLLAALSAKDAERERALLAFRKGWSSEAELGAALAEIAGETAELRRRLEALGAELDVARAWEARATTATRLLARLGARLDALEAGDDPAARRALFADLIDGGTARAADGPGGRRAVDVEVTYVFGGRRAVDINTASHAGNRDTGSATNRRACP